MSTWVTVRMMNKYFAMRIMNEGQGYILENEYPRPKIPIPYRSPFPLVDTLFAAVWLRKEEYYREWLLKSVVQCCQNLWKGVLGPVSSRRINTGTDVVRSSSIYHHLSAKWNKLIDLWETTAILNIEVLRITNKPWHGNAIFCSYIT